MTNKTKGTIKGIVAAAVAFVLAGGVATSIYMGVKNNGWFKKTETKQTEKTDEESAYSGAILGDVEENGIKLYSAAVPMSDLVSTASETSAESAYTITATITNADTAFDMGITLSAEFVNASSTWATGKSVSDYVTLSTTHILSGESFTVTCKQAFGEQIKIIVIADGSPEGSPRTASVLVDYCKRVTGATIQIDGYTYTSTNTSFSYDEDADSSGYTRSITLGADCVPYYYYSGPEDHFDNVTINGSGTTDSMIYCGSWDSTSSVDSGDVVLEWNASTGVLTFNAWDYFDGGRYWDTKTDVAIYVLYAKKSSVVDLDGATSTITSLNSNFTSAFIVSLDYSTGTYTEEQTLTLSTPNSGKTYTLSTADNTTYFYSETITWKDLCTSSFGYTSGSEKTLYENLKTAYSAGTGWDFTVKSIGALTGNTYSFTSDLIINPAGLYGYASGVSVSASSIKF